MLGLTSVCVFLFSALALAVGSGYSLGAGTMLLASTWLLWKRPRLGLQRKDYVLIGVLLFYFLIYTINMLWHGDPSRELDMPLRALLAIAVLLLLLAYPPRAEAWWAGLAIGAIAGTALACWQLLYLHISRPQAATSNAIHYGNVSMLLGMLSLAGLDWANKQRHRIAWISLMGLGCVAGVAGSVLSSSRGGWIAFPICIAIFVLYRSRQYGKRYLCPALLGLAAVVLLPFFIPHSPVAQRATMAIAELEKFQKDRNVDTSVGQRLEMWRLSWAMSHQNPWLGLGRSGYMDQKEALFAQGKLSAPIKNYTNAHNDYLDALTKRGIPGVLALLALFFVPLTLFVQALRSAPRRPALRIGRHHALHLLSDLRSDHQFADAQYRHHHASLPDDYPVVDAAATTA